MTVWLRASLPRMRYDRLMALGWKYLIEIAILWVLVSTALVVGISFAVLAAAYGMLTLAFRASRQRRAIEEVF